MTLTPGNNPYALFTGLDGRPLNGGKVYIGVAGQDPETNPQPVFWDAEGQTAAAQPLETQAGYIWNSGTPARFWTQDLAYSIRVRDRLGRQVFYAANVAFEIPDGAVTADALPSDNTLLDAITEKLKFLAAGAGAVYRSLRSKMRDVADLADYGALYDGTTDATAAFAAALASPTRNITISGPVSVSNGQTLSVTKSVRCVGNGVIIARDETGIGSGTGLLNVSADDCDLDLRFDGNGLGPSAVVLSGNRNRARVSAKNFVGSASTAGYESVVLVLGNDNVVWAEGYNLAKGAAPTGNVPRVISCQGNGTNTTIELLRGRNVAGGITVGAHTDITIEWTDLDTVTDNGFYFLGASSVITVNGGFIRNCPEPGAFAGSYYAISDLVVEDCGPFGVQNVNNLYLKGCHKRYGTMRPSAFVSSRDANVSSNTVVLEGCTGAFTPTNGGIMQFLAGSVNDVRVIGGYYKLTWTDVTNISTRIVRHAAGSGVVYKDFTLEVVDQRTTPLTSSDALLWDIPTLSQESVWEDVNVINRTAAVVRVTGVVQQSLYIRSPGGYLVPNFGPNLQFYSAGTNQVRRDVWSTAMPTSGSWAAGDIVRNAAPTVAGAAGSRYIVEGWRRLTTGSTHVLNQDWAEIRASTGA